MRLSLTCRDDGELNLLRKLVFGREAGKTIAEVQFERLLQIAEHRSRGEGGRLEVTYEAISGPNMHLVHVDNLHVGKGSLRKTLLVQWGGLEHARAGPPLLAEPVLNCSTDDLLPRLWASPDARRCEDD